ncbi:hypothetical protein CJF30_00009646 [Rutstroemia sp. NJR-2017a BBW]|nr:hypothetical protein CJF30_00009646 [Rutstroemia sp. NJR-2017a BBW]
MTKTIAVLGATGAQGGSVAEKFLSLGWHVRGITRNDTSDAARTLASKGIEVVPADIDDPATLIPAFSGAEVIFAVTDFWAPFFTSFRELSQVSDRATGEHALSIELKRGKTIVDAATEVLTKEGKLKRFIWSTLPSVKELSKGKYTYTYHYESKAQVSKYLQERKDLWERSSLLYMGFYTTNIKVYKNILGFVKQVLCTDCPSKENEPNKYVYRNIGSKFVLHPFVVPTDTGIFVDLLVRASPKKLLMGVSEMTSVETLSNTWSEVTGRQSEVKELAVGELLMEWPDKPVSGSLVREVAKGVAASAEFGWGDVVLPNEIDPKVKTTSLKEYFQGEDWTEY